MQPERLSGMTLNRDAIVRPTTIHEIVELYRNDAATRNGSNNEFSSNSWQAGGKSRFIYLPPGYNNDPCIKLSVHVKPTVIDLEGYGESYADKGQANAA